ncbi:MAG TPA: EipA family protein [Novosphingobium sp.]|nr:EipA family protein [Novosphingobium sp.]
MIVGMPRRVRGALFSLFGAVALAASVSAPAQVQPVDPDRAIDGDLTPPQGTPSPAPTIVPTPPADSAAVPGETVTTPDTGPAETPAGAVPENPGTYQRDDVLGAAESVFGKGAAGLAGLIEDLLRKQGEPNAYITGREGGGALVVGLRYGSGTLFHKIEGQRPVYWTGPSVGFDAGANAASTFVLVYNLYNTEDIFKRYAAGEGQAYLVGGFNVSYLRRGDVVLIPIRMGVGLRLGVNAGYMKFSRKQNWFPF